MVKNEGSLGEKRERRETDRQRDRQTDKDRQADRLRQRETGRKDCTKIGVLRGNVYKKTKDWDLRLL